MDSTDSAPADNDIAIVGVALRVPGARDPERYWQNIRDGVESVRTYSDDELSAAGVSSAELSNPNYVRAGAPLDGMDLFDAEFFGFGPKEAAIMDPQHRQFLECAWEALESAGHVPARFAGAIGVFAGCGMGSYFAHNILTNRDLVESVGLFLLRHTGNDKDFLATRASYCLDLHGPSVNVQTACSTSLVAVHLAVQSLLSGECDLALAGGVTLEIPHRQGYLYHEGEILAPDGHCRPFDHRAEGTVFGSGAGVVVLRRLSDALADGDAVIAVIKGSAVNNDGARKVGYLAPSVDGQAAAIAEALSVAGVTADSIGLVECHGTGTAMGDPIEIAALTQAFASGTQRKGYCAVGSVKSNIGHLDTAAGVAALIKAALALQHRVLPPSLNFERANPQIEFDKTPFFVNDRLQPWAAGPTARRAGVNSLGVGGTNAYVVLEEAPAQAKPPARLVVAGGPPRPYLLLLSARNRRSLGEQHKRLAAHLQAHPEIALEDVAHTLFTARQHFDVRRVLAASSRDDALRLLGDDDSHHVYTHTRRDRPSLVFMFPGGGAQYPRMGAGLLAGDAVYREHIERGLMLAQQRFNLALRPLLLPEPAGLEQAARELERPSLQLPLLFIVEYALAQSWLSRGVQPSALIGHSMGENSAACVAGVIDFATTLGLVALRGRLFESLPDGGMLSVPLSAAELTPLLPAGVVIACENAPNLTVASGPRAALDSLAASLAARGSEAQPIRIRIAAHSPMLEPILSEFGAYLRNARLSPPRIPIVSNLSGALLSDSDACDPDYWVRHLRNTVRFERGIATLEREPGRIYLEVGPGRALGSLVRQCLADPQANAPIATLRRPDESIDDESFRLAALGRLWASGVEVDLAEGLPKSARRVHLPSYAFDHKAYFIAPGKLAAVSGGLARIAAIEDWFFQPVWRWRELEREELSGPGEQTYLLFADEFGVADRLAQQLQAAGHRCVFVRKSGAYGQTDVLEYEVAPHAPHSYATLVQELTASEKLPDRILHFWSLDSAVNDETASEWAYDPSKRMLSFDSLFHLLHAFGTESVIKPMHLTVVTTGAVRLMAEALPHPEQALVKGICQVIPRESPNLSAAWVDLPQPRRARSWLRAGQLDNLDALVGWLENEARSHRKCGTIAYRDGRRFEQDHEAAPRTAAASSSSRLRDAGSYAITGGLGGLGLAIARHLAQQHRARLLLISRKALPARDAWARVLREQPADHPSVRAITAVQELEAAGAQVELAQADVADLEQMRAALQQARSRFGHLHGIFHAAGVLDDRLLALKTLSEANDVLRPKLDGTWVLHQLTRNSGVELLVLFSSTSVLIGPPGQADYVAANAFMDAYAESRRGEPGPLTVAVQWGVWRDVGMAAEAARSLRASDSPRAPSKVQGPFFDTRQDAADGSVLFAGRHAADSSWWLGDHRLSDGTAVLPGTGYLQLMAAAVGEFGVRRPFELRDATFLRPLSIDDDATTKSIRVRVRREAEGHSLEVQSTYSEQAVDMGYLTHAVAHLRALDVAEPAPLDLAAIRARTGLRVLERSESIRTPQEAHLRFGPRFRCLRRAYFGEAEALGELALDAELASDVETTSLHAGLLDLGTGFAMELIPGYDPQQGLWAPLSYRRLRLHAALPAQCVAWVRKRAGSNETSIGFDVTLCDSQGRVCVLVEELMLRRVPAGQTLAQLARPSAQELEPDPALAAVRHKTAPSPAEAAFRANLEAGITPREGGPALELVLTGHVPSCITVSSLAPRALLSQLDESALPQRASSARFARPELDAPYVAPSDPLHKELTEIWEQILGIEGIGIKDGFFELGGHSLTAVRLTAEVRKRFGVELGLSALFEAPTVERLAELLAQTRRVAVAAAESGSAVGAKLREFTPVVPIKARGSQRPLFCVAGQGGNPMHLRTLAHYLGAERPFYGLQHRGLDGRSVPYASVEEMASDFVRNVEKIDPGPYLIAGYSGGGTAALEMARQLRAAGKGVDAVVLLDSFCPIQTELGFVWRLRAHLEGLQDEGVEYARRRVAVRLKRERQRLERRFLRRPNPVAQSRSQFETAASNWQAIEGRYRPQPFEGSAFLFRVASPDADDARYFEERYGRWNALFTHGVQSFAVPGSHVSMCEEPNVQVLAERLRDVLDRLDAAARAAQ
jgi:acyl transferase domain-containing protein/thioesterase domain-containing protein/acyl carrier protein